MDYVLGLVDLKRRNSSGSSAVKNAYARKKICDYHFRNLHLNSSIEFYQSGYLNIQIFGKITRIYSEDYNLIEYRYDQINLISKLFKKYGPNFINMIEGYFLLILYDDYNDHLYIFNNRYLSSTLYYYNDGKKLIFSNTISNILNSMDEHPGLNKGTLLEFLNGCYIYSENTMFNNIYRLEPGYFLLCQGRDVNLHRYWKMAFNRKPIRNMKKAVDQYESVIQAGIKDFIDYNDTKKLGCYLSGGVDTSFITAHAAKLFDKKVHAFTGALGYEMFDETEKARFVCDRFGVIHHPVKIKSGDLDLIPSILRTVEEPAGDISLPMYKCAIEASKYVDTVMTGDCGDNLHGQYYSVAEVQRYMQFTPYILRRLLHSFALLMTKITNSELIWEMEHVSKVFSKKNFYKDFYRRLVTYGQFDAAARNQLLRKSFMKGVSMNQCTNEILMTRKHFFDDLIESNVTYGVLHYMLPWTHKPLSQKNTLFYVPYLNKQVVDFINTLPIKTLAKGSSVARALHMAEQRHFHKKALRKLIPNEFIKRQNQSFDQPFDFWFKERPGILENLVVSLKKRGYFKEYYLDQLLDQFNKRKFSKKYIFQISNHGYRIFSLLNVEIWCREFFDDFNKKNKEKPLEDYLADK